MSGEEKRYVGVDVGGTKILAVMATGDGEVLLRFKQPTAEGGSPLSEQIAAAIDSLLDEAQVAVDQVGGIGVAVPGVVDSQTGLFIVAPNVEIDDPHLVDRLRERYHVPVAIGNDVNLGTLAEVWLGAGRDARSVVGIFVGTGIGGGVVVDGGLRTGPEDLAGEIGHLVLMVDGPECGCGNRGCFEAIASRSALERDLREALAAGRESQIAEAAEKGRIKSGALAAALAFGDELVTELMQRMGHYLGQGVLTIRHMLDPELIILGGGVTEACGDFLLPIIEAEVRADCMKGSRDVLRIVTSELGDDAVALGAVALIRGDVTGRAVGEAARSSEEQAAAGPHIDAVAFGSVTVSGEELPHDIVIRANGKVAKRKKKRARSKYGTSHVIDEKELQQVCKGEPRTVIIGQGFHSMVRLTDDAQEYLNSLAAAWQLLPTPDAVEAYNDAQDPKALLLHVTC